MLDQTSWGGAWIPASGETDPWLEIDVGEPMTITGFVTQGRGAHYCTVTCNSWVKTAKIQYRLEEEGEAVEIPKTFTCNVVGDVLESITNYFDTPVLARYIRILPQTCNNCAMRAGLVVTSPTLPEFSIPVSILSVLPAERGFGGSHNVTIVGNGYHTDERRVAVSICGFPCKVTKSTLSEIVCVPNGFTDTTLVPALSSTMDIVVKDGNNDATQDLQSLAIVLSR